MMTFFLALIVFAVIFAGMAVGVIFSNKPIKGSCGGLNNVGIEGDCEICGRSQGDRCENEPNDGLSKADVARLTRDAGQST